VRGVSLLDLELRVAFERRRDEAAAGAAHVVADEEARPLLGNAPDLASLEPARSLGGRRDLHTPPPTIRGPRRRARTSMRAWVGDSTTSCARAQRSQSANTRSPLRQSVVVSSRLAWWRHIRHSITPRSASSWACCTHARRSSGRIVHLVEPTHELLAWHLHVLDVLIATRELEPSGREPLLLGAQLFTQSEELLRARQQGLGARRLWLQILHARLDARERQRDRALGPVVADLPELAVEDVARQHAPLL